MSTAKTTTIGKRTRKARVSSSLIDHVVAGGDQRHKRFRAKKTFLKELASFDLNGDVLRLPPPQESALIIREGFQYVFVSKLASHLGVQDNFVLQVIGVRGGTAERRKKEQMLKPDESGRLYRVMKVTALAERVLEDPAKAKTWLQRENRALGGVTPFSLLDNEAGAEAVEDALNRIDYGVYS